MFRSVDVSIFLVTPSPFSALESDWLRLLSLPKSRSNAGTRSERNALRSCRHLLRSTVCALASPQLVGTMQVTLGQWHNSTAGMVTHKPGEVGVYIIRFTPNIVEGKLPLAIKARVPNSVADSDHIRGSPFMVRVGASAATEPEEATPETEDLFSKAVREQQEREAHEEEKRRAEEESRYEAEQRKLAAEDEREEMEKVRHHFCHHAVSSMGRSQDSCLCRMQGGMLYKSAGKHWNEKLQKPS
jgi:hypothetical protein